MEANGFKKEIYTDTDMWTLPPCRKVLVHISTVDKSVLRYRWHWDKAIHTLFLVLVSSVWHLERTKQVHVYFVILIKYVSIKL